MIAPGQGARQWLWTGGASAILVLCAARMWSQPLIADEVDFVSAARDWPALGGLVPHPPGYVQLIRLMFAIFGPGAGPARAIGVASGLLTLWMIPALVRALACRPDRAMSISILATWLFALSPLAIQNTMLLDIDNTVMVPAVLGLLWLWWKSSGWGSVPRALALAGGLTVTAWLKLPPPLLLVIAIAAASILERRWSDLGVITAAALLSAGVFALTFGLLARVTGFGYAQMLGTFAKVAWLADVPGMLSRAPQTAGVFLLWLTPAQAALWAMGSRRSSAGESDAGGRAQYLVVIYTVIVVGFYALLLPPAWGFPKYQASVLPLIAILVAGVLDRSIRGSARRSRIGLWLVGAGFFVVQLAFVRDPLLPIYRTTLDTAVGQLGTRLAASLPALGRAVVWVPLSVILGWAVAVRAHLPRRAAVTACLGAALLGTLTATTLVQVAAPYSTRYRYGTSAADLYSVCRRLGAALPESSFIVAPKEVLYYAFMPGRIVYDYVWESANPESILSLSRNHRVEAFVWTTREENRAGRVINDLRVAAMLRGGYSRGMEGSFVVWLIRPDSPDSLP